MAVNMKNNNISNFSLLFQWNEIINFQKSLKTELLTNPKFESFYSHQHVRCEINNFNASLESNRFESHFHKRILNVRLWSYITQEYNRIWIACQSRLFCDRIYGQYYRVRQISFYFFFLENALQKNYWIFSQISFFIWKYNTYIIGHDNPSVRIIDLVSHTTYVVCVNFYT